MSTERQLLAQLATMEGWCGPQKALALYQHVLEHKPAVCIEIGVFGGKSLLAIAYGLKQAEYGVVVGVDTWQADESLVDIDPTNADWWKAVDLQKIYAGCLAAIEASGAKDRIEICKESSYQAASRFPVPVDLLHIDGCHSEWSSTSDVCLWLPKVKSGGYVFLDDVNWASTQTAVRFVQKWCDLICTQATKESTFSIYKKR